MWRHHCLHKKLAILWLWAYYRTHNRNINNNTENLSEMAVPCILWFCYKLTVLTYDCYDQTYWQGLGICCPPVTSKFFQLEEKAAVNKYMGVGELIEETERANLVPEQHHSYRLDKRNAKRNLMRKYQKNYPQNPTKKEKIATPEEVNFEVSKEIFKPNHFNYLFNCLIMTNFFNCQILFNFTIDISFGSEKMMYR